MIDDLAAKAPWLEAIPSDFEGINFEQPIANESSADCHELSDRFLAAHRELDASTASDVQLARAYSMLAAISGMHFKPSEPNEPFGPMMTWGDRRTAVPSDFRMHVALIASLAERASNPVLRARLCDLCWFLERKRAALGLKAVSAYEEIILRVRLGTLHYRFEHHRGVLEHDTKEILRRALQIGWSAGRDQPANHSVRDLGKNLRREANSSGDLVSIFWFSEIDVDFRISAPAEVASDIEISLNAAPQNDFHIVVELWRLAARGYHIGKVEDGKNRCLCEAADRLVLEAQSKSHSSMLASHFLSDAIAQLHGIPGQKEKRKALRYNLIEIQENIPDEMSSFSQPLELEDIIRVIESAMRSTSLIEKIFIFADLARSPDPAKLLEDAKQNILDHPLSALFGTNHVDREGKTISRSGSGGFGQDPDDGAVRHQIFQGEALRRKLVTAGKIAPAMQIIMTSHQVSEETLTPILRGSPFIAHEKLHTFARGFARFFQGDFVSATYILIPLLESSLRHILKVNGHDVTIFDDASKTQEDRTISSIFEQMRRELESVITVNIAADIERVFLDKPGPQVRHSLAHGLMHDGDPYGSDAIYACWIIYRLCLLPLFPHRSELEASFAGNEYYSGSS